MRLLKLINSCLVVGEEEEALCAKLKVVIFGKQTADRIAVVLLLIFSRQSITRARQLCLHYMFEDVQMKKSSRQHSQQ